MARIWFSQAELHCAIPDQKRRIVQRGTAKSFSIIPMPRPRNGSATIRECQAPCVPINMQRIREMYLNANELEYLSAWAREEKARDPYALPAHQLQAAH